MVWHEIFPTQKHAKLHHLATTSDNTNVVSNPEKGDQTVHGCSTKNLQNPAKFTAKLQIIKYCQNTAKNLQNCFHQTIYFNNGLNSNFVTRLI